MAVIANRRSVMTLFSGATDPWSHRTRLVLAEKGINIDFQEVTEANHFFANTEKDLIKTLDQYIKKETTLF